MNNKPILAMILALIVPVMAFADTLTFRNDTRASLVVQTASIVRGTLKRDQPYLLRPTGYTPQIQIESDKVIFVYDGKSNRVLFQAGIKVPKTPASFSIQSDPTKPGKVRLMSVPRRP